tara:strand:+ start:707 stop:901 length:195 start_codon:yes stop_codon:yes gene_type:complete
MFGDSPTTVSGSVVLTPFDQHRETCENVITCLMVASQLAEEENEIMRDVFLTTISALPRVAGEA